MQSKNAVSKKDLDDSIGTEQAAKAAVLSAQAAVDKAKLDLGFTRITSPVDGISGLAKAQIGNLVGPGATEELTTVSTVQPIKAYIQVSEQEYIQSGRDGEKRAETSEGGTHPRRRERLSLQGHLRVCRQADRRQDGDHHGGSHLPQPGQFPAARPVREDPRATSVRKDALLVPQRAVAEVQGKYMVAVVGADNKVDIRPVQAAERVDSLWVILEGLKPGERVVVEGIQKVRPG